jgi:hypothetical protein
MSSPEPATRLWWRTPRTWVAFALGEIERELS